MPRKRTASVGAPHLMLSGSNPRKACNEQKSSTVIQIVVQLQVLAAGCCLERTLPSVSRGTRALQGFLICLSLTSASNIGQPSAVLVRISDGWGAPDDNCFTLARSVEAGVQSVPLQRGRARLLGFL